MSGKLVILGARSSQRKGKVRSPNLRRVIRMSLRFRRTLVMGLLCTVVYACLHTVGIMTAFPVFKVLLDEEGVGGWVDRTVAGWRLGAELSPPVDAGGVRVVKVTPDGVLDRAGVAVDARIWTAEDNDRGILQYLAELPAGSTAMVSWQAGGDEASDRATTVTLQPDDPSSMARWLLRSGRWLGQGGAAGKLNTLTYLLVGLVIVVVMANVFRYAGEVLLADVVFRTMMELRGLLYDRTLHLPMSFFSGQATSDIAARFIQDIQEIQRGLQTLYSKFLREPLRAAFILGWAMWLDWRVTVAMVVVGPFAVIIFWTVGRSVKKSSRRLLAAYGTMMAALTSTLQSLRVVKAFTAEAHERRRLREVDEQVFKQQLKLVKMQAFVSPMMETVAIVGGSFVIIWLAGRVLEKDMPMADFAALGVAMSVLFDPLKKVTDVYVRLQRAAGGADRVFQVINEPIESELSNAKVEFQPLQTSMDYVGVSFTYPGADQPALIDITLSIRRGETVAIVGPNGCGKTTLMSMLLRFFDPTEGAILYDGVDIRDATLPSLRRQIGIVTQDAIIFDAGARENIAYGQDGATDVQRVEDAARRASADEFVKMIPGGYDGELGERGGKLSGGQRQRLAIARAIYRDAPVLIFDEATSQIDSESEQKIQLALQKFAKDRTTLIVAHRLSTIKFADRIVVMDAGRVIDTGVHADLFGRCAIYRALCETQFVSEPADG